MGADSGSALVLYASPESPESETVARTLETDADFDVLRATTLDRVTALRVDHDVDCIVCGLPASDALDVLDSVRADSDVPFVLSGQDGGERFVTRALRKGVTDYVPDQDREELLDRVRAALDTGGQRGDDATEEPQDRHLLDALESALPGSVYVVSESGECLDAILGRERDYIASTEELIGQTVTEFFPDGAAQNIQETLTTTLATGDFQTVEYAVNVGDEIRWFEGRMVPLAEGYNGAGAVLLTAHEITDRKQRELRLQQYTQLVDAVGDPMYVLDADGYIERVNNTLLEYTGYRRTELLGRAIGEIVPAKEFDRATQRLATLEESEDRESDTFETKLVTKDGEVILTEANVTVLTDEMGNYAGAVGVLRDIRDRKQRERDLDLLKQVLARVFRHNVRNELTVIQIYAELVNESVESGLREYTETIMERAQQLREHSEKATHMEQVVEMTTRSETDLASTVERLADSYRETYPDAEIEVDLPGSRPVEGHTMLDKAIEELLDNAIQHAPENETPTVRIWLEATDEFLTLYVEDESGGLADHEIDVLREGTESDLEHSSGVGLWLVRWLVEYSNADMIAHRTAEGSLMGLRFRQSGHQTTATIENSPVARAPAHVQESQPRQVHGEVVVGRMDGLHQLEDTYDDVERTGGHVVLIRGETGVGKSTLIEQFRERLTEYDRPPLIATGRCTSGTTPPYHVFQQALADLPVETGLQDLTADTERGADDRETTQQRKQSLFVSIADELRGLAIDHPLVLVLEDLQWADTGTTDMFEFLIEEVGRWAPPILFVGTYRTDEVGETHPIVRFADATADSGRGTVLDLEPFDGREVKNLLVSVLGIEQVPASLVDAVADHTGGRPLFVAEIAHHLAETVDGEPTAEALPETLDDVAVPDSVESAVVDRLERLTDPVTAVLEVGAVAGRTVSFAVLQEASERSEADLATHVETLVQRRIWEESDGTISFVHGVIRDIVLDRIDEQRRATLHGRVARAIEAGAEDGPNQYGRLATHYDAAGEYRTAVENYRQAGDRAADRYAHEGAIEHYERALTLARDHDVASDEELADLLGDLADVYTTIGAFDRSRELTEEGLAVTPARSLEECRLLGIKSETYYEQSEYEQARETALRQRELAAAGDAWRLQVTAVRRLGLIARDRGEYDDAREHLQKSLERIQGHDATQLEATSLKELGTTMYYQGEYDQAREYFEESLALFETTADRREEGRCRNNLGLLARKQGRYDDAREYYDDARDVAQDVGDRHGQAITLTNLGALAVRQGEYERGREQFEQSVAIVRDVGDPWIEAEGLTNLGKIEREYGNYEQARDYFEGSLDIRRRIGDRRGVGETLTNVARLCSKQGNDADARDYLTDSLEITRDIGDEPGTARNLTHRGRLERRAGAYEDARESLSRARELFAQRDEQAALATVDLEYGYLALETGDIDEALSRLDRAQDRFATLDATHWLARCRQLRGEVAAATGDANAAREYWQATLETFLDLGVPDDALTTLERLVETCHEQGDDDQAGSYCEQARDVLADAPEPVARTHEPWVDQQEARLDTT